VNPEGTYFTGSKIEILLVINDYGAACVDVVNGESFNNFWAEYGNTFPSQFVRVAAVVKLNYRY
jgi:hypothetical protein